MSKEPAPAVIALSHGARRLPGVEVISYNVELKDKDGFVGDRVSKSAFRHFIDEWCKPLRRIGQDPFGNEVSSKIAKKKLDDLLAKGDVESAGVRSTTIARSEAGARPMSGGGVHPTSWEWMRRSPTVIGSSLPRCRRTMSLLSAAR